MKIEDIKYTLPTTQIAAEDFDKEKWLKENPIDYFKMVYVLLTTANNAPENLPRSVVMANAFKTLYSIIRLYLPNTLYKFCSLTENEKLNRMKLSTLRNKQIFMSDIKDFNDPFDGKGFFYKPSELSNIKRLASHNGRLIDDFTSSYNKSSSF